MHLKRIQDEESKWPYLTLKNKNKNFGDPEHLGIISAYLKSVVIIGDINDNTF
jgi:hypothetical protein